MFTFFVDGRAQELARSLLPENVIIKSVGQSSGEDDFSYPISEALIGAIALTGEGAQIRAALADGPYAKLSVVELDPAHPESGSAELMQLLMVEMKALRRQIGEARAVAAQFRSESIGVKSRLREIENLLYSLGNPQLLNALTWQPTGAVLSLESGQSVGQILPISAVSLTAIDVWFPQVVMPVINDLAVVIEDAAGQVYPMRAVTPDVGLETGWIRFRLAEPISGVGRDCQLRLTWSGDGSISVGLGQPVPDFRFRATLNVGESPDETVALRAWQSLGGVRLPPCSPAIFSGHTVSIREAEFVAPSALPRPELFALPVQAADHVSTAFWQKEDVILVHPSRSGPACAIIRGVDLAGLSHISALVTVGHVRAPSLNFAIGVAPHGLVDEDGFWQRRIGPWLTGMPARGWGQAHCIPVEPITGKADILLAASLAADVPNDLSWALFRGFRFSRGNQISAAVNPIHASAVRS